MPTYDYFCEANGRKVEVQHKMSERIGSWGELCDQAGLEPGDTPRETPVRKLISGGAIIGSSSLSNPEPACSTGSCCPGGFCGLTQ
jgi:hypothetical protein